MVDRDPLAPPVDPDEPITRKSPRRRRRPRMGDVIASMGARATVQPAKTVVVDDLARRDQQAKAKVFLEAGKNRGEQKGFGATAGQVPP